MKPETYEPRPGAWYAADDLYVEEEQPDGRFVQVGSFTHPDHALRAVRAVNAHDVLVEAARAVYDAMEVEYHEDGRVACYSSPHEILRVLLPKLRAALRAAEGDA